MTDRHDKRGKTRREFLKNATFAGGGLMASVALPGASAVAAETEAERPVGAEEGYRVTEHIASYYKTLES
jgi:hypothetical protein